MKYMQKDTEEIVDIQSDPVSDISEEISDKTAETEVSAEGSEDTAPPETGESGSEAAEEPEMTETGSETAEEPEMTETASEGAVGPESTETGSEEAARAESTETGSEEAAESENSAEDSEEKAQTEMPEQESAESGDGQEKNDAPSAAVEAVTGENAAPQAAAEAVTGENAEVSGSKPTGSLTEKIRQRIEAYTQQYGQKKVILTACGAAALCVFALYAVKAGTYEYKFLADTQYNGINVSGLSATQVQEKLGEQVAEYTMHITFSDGTTADIPGSSFGLAYAADDTVQNTIDSQNPWTWAGRYFGVTYEYTEPVGCTYDESALKTVLEALPQFQAENITESVDAGMVYDSSAKCFQLQKEVYGNRLQEDLVLQALEEAISSQTTDITFDDSYYVKPQLLSDDAALTKQIADLNEFLATTITIHLHRSDDYVIDADTLNSWLTQDETNPNWYSIDDESLKQHAVEAAASIAESEDGVYSSFSFKSTKCGTVKIPCSEYGYTIDQEAEAAQIYQELSTRTSADRKPTYSREDDAPVGDSYAEVDIKNQEVFIYVDGELKVDVSCVTGKDVDPERRTDRGLFTVYNKLKNHTMLGPRDKNGKPSYSSHTNFAIYFNRGEAFHDASWRSKFGGTIYKYNGSHGCVNLSYASAKKVWDNTYIGMPVIVFG